MTDYIKNLTNSNPKELRRSLLAQIMSMISIFGKLDSQIMYQMLKDRGVTDMEIARKLGITRQAVGLKYASYKSTK